MLPEFARVRLKACLVGEVLSIALSVSYERLRQIVEAEGQLVLEVQRKELLAAEFSAEDCKTSSKGPKRLYVGTDGVMVPMVTEAEKNEKRKARGPKRAGGRRRRMHKGLASLISSESFYWCQLSSTYGRVDS